MPKKKPLRQLLMEAARQPEYNSGVPVEAPAGFTNRPELLEETIRRLISEVREKNVDIELETPEDADDFDVDYEELAFNPTLYELDAMAAEVDDFNPEAVLPPAPAPKGALDSNPAPSEASEETPEDNSLS